MIFLQLIFFLAIFTIGGGMLFYAFTRDRRYARFAYRWLIVLLVLVGILFAFYAVERIANTR